MPPPPRLYPPLLCVAELQLELRWDPVDREDASRLRSRETSEPFQLLPAEEDFDSIVDERVPFPASRVALEPDLSGLSTEFQPPFSYFDQSPLESRLYTLPSLPA